MTDIEVNAKQTVTAEEYTTIAQ